jgi:hypothetical protein
MSLDVIEMAKKRMKEAIEGKTRVLEVEDLLTKEGETVKMYIRPITSDEFQKMIKGEDEIERAILTIIYRARTEEGKKIFTLPEKNEIRNNFDPAILLKLSRRINEDLADIYTNNDGINVLGNSPGELQEK